MFSITCFRNRGLNVPVNHDLVVIVEQGFQPRLDTLGDVVFEVSVNFFIDITVSLVPNMNGFPGKYVVNFGIKYQIRFKRPNNKYVT